MRFKDLYSINQTRDYTIFIEIRIRGSWSCLIKVKTRFVDIIWHVKCQWILTKSVLSILVDFLHFLFLLSCTDLFIILTILPLCPSMFDPWFESWSLVSVSSPHPPPVNKSHKSPRPPPSSPQSLFVFVSWYSVSVSW